MPPSLQSSRLARYSLAATAAAAGSGGAAIADVTSGSLNLSFGRSAGAAFFNGFSSTSNSTIGSATLGIGNLSIYLYGFQASNYADASVFMSIWDASSNYAQFNQSQVTIATGSGATGVYGGAMVGAGVVWEAGTSTTSSWYGQIFWTYYASFSDTATWTNPDATGTKFVNFFLDGEDGDIYGWVQLDWDVTDANDWSVTISNWAYSDDGPLAAGSTGVPAVPGLGGRAALAVGAAGVRGRRQRVAG